MIAVNRNTQISAQRVFNRLKDALFIKPLIPYWRQKLNGKLMVYLYHRIGKEGEFPYLDQGGSPITSEDEFRKDLMFLKQQSARFLRFRDINEAIFDGKTFNVIICFDDGFACNYREGLDLLEEFSIPSTIFQCSQMIEPDTLIWEHQLYWLFYHPVYSQKFKATIKQFNPDWPESCGNIRETVHPKLILGCIEQFLDKNSEAAKEIQQQAKAAYPSVKDIQNAESWGHEIGSHGADHFKRENISDSEFENEIGVSFEKLTKTLSSSPESFSYPFNSYKVGDEKVCRELFKFVATVDGENIYEDHNLLKLPRYTWPGRAKNTLRQRRWLLTGHI